MPRSRASRSASPQSQRPVDTAICSEYQKTFQNVKEIFQSSLDDEIIRMVLIECNWRDEVAIDKLLAIAEDAEAQKQYKQKNSQLRKIAEGVLGPISFEDYKTHGTHRASVIPDSKLTASEKIIGRPKKSDGVQSSKSLVHGNKDFLVARGSSPAASKPHVNPSSEDIDLHFPKLPSKHSGPPSAFSSDSSQSHQSIKYSGVFRDSSFISQAQSAYNQQFDDAASAQRWEQYKQQISEHYVENLKEANPGDSAPDTKNQDKPVYLVTSPDRPDQGTVGPVESCEVVLDTKTSKPKAERSFPVRLISKDREEQEDLARPKKLTRLDSADLDDNILKYIYEVPVETIEEEGEIPEKKSQSQSGTPRSVTPRLETPRLETPPQNNLPMTLPIIGLSVEAKEFVPRPKSSKADTDDTASSGKPSPSPPVDTPVSKTSQVNMPASSPSTQALSRSNISTPIEIKTGTRNVRNETSPGVVPLSSPILASSVSPVQFCRSPPVQHGRSPPVQHGRSPPVSIGPGNPTSLAGSPVFLTYKWPHGITGVTGVTSAPSHQPHIITASPRFIPGPQPQPHLPHGATFRFQPGPPPMSFHNRMVYPLTQPPFFRMAGVPPPHITSLRPPPVHRPRLPTDLEERAAIATGSPLLTGAESQRNIPQPAGAPQKLVNPSWIVQCMQKIKEKQKAGKKVMVIVRGLPGSGKTTLSRNLQMEGVVLSTDDFFIQGNYYKYNPDKLTESHQWNRERAKEAMKMGNSPIIIDNTNTQKWEFKSYVNMAINNNYHVEIFEPDTPWKFKPSELAKKTVHAVPKDQIQRMMGRYEHHITVESVTGKNNNPSKTNDAKRTQRGPNDEQISDNKVTERLDGGPTRQTDTNRSWDLNEEKAAHLSRHHSDSPTSSSRASSTDRALGSRSRPSSMSSPGTATPDPDFQESETLKKNGDENIDSDIDDPNSVLVTHSASVSQASADPSEPLTFKYEKANIDEMEIVERTELGKKRIDNKEKIDEVSAKLTAETLQQINAMLDAYMKGTDMSDDALQRREHELSALLQLLPVETAEMDAAELLIHLKLHDGHVEEIVGSDTETEDVEIECNPKLIESKINNEGDGKEVISETNLCDHGVLIESADRDNTNDDRNINIEDVDDVSDDECVEKKTANGVVLNEETSVTADHDGIIQKDKASELLTDNNDKEIFSDNTSKVILTDETSKEILTADTDTCGDDLLEGISSSDRVLNDERNGVNNLSVLSEPTNIESKYWSTYKAVDPNWDGNTVLDDNWGDMVTADEQSERDLVKPQRVRRQKHLVNNVKNNNNNVALKEDTECANKTDQGSEIKNDSGNASTELNQNVDNQTVVNVDGNIKNEETGGGEEQISDELNKLETDSDRRGSIQKENSATNGEIVESVCVGEITDVKQSNVNNPDKESCDIQKDPQVTDSVISPSEPCLLDASDSNINDVNNVPSMHNNSLDLLKENYSDIDVLEDQAASQGVNNGSSNPTEVTDMLKTTCDTDNKVIVEGGLSAEVTRNGKNLVVDTNVVDINAKNDKSINGSTYMLDKVETKNSKASEAGKSPPTSQLEKPKRRTRKIAANFKEPLISSEDKKKLFSKDWSSLSVTAHAPPPEVDTTTGSHHEDLLKLTDSATMTCDEDFMEVENLNRGGFISSSVKYLVGKSKKFINNHHSDTNESFTISKVHLIHKSTSTDDLEDMSYSESVKFLKTCFPNVREDELECVLVNCHDNVEWAINLLLDWKYSLHLSEDEKQKFVDGMEKVKLAAKPFIQPSPLTNLCFKMIENQRIATREELEEQLIETTKERLKRVENETITKIRLRRSSSLNESAEEARNNAAISPSPPVFVRSQSAPSQSKQQLDVLTEIMDGQDNQLTSDVNSVSSVNYGDTGSTGNCEIKTFEDAVDKSVHGNKDDKSQSENKETVFNEKSLNTPDDVDSSDGSMKLTDKMERIKRHVENRNLSGLRRELVRAGDIDGDVVELAEGGTDLAEEMGVTALTISLPTDVVTQLEDMFGPLGPISDVSQVSVPIDHKMAFRLYQCIKHGMVSYSRQQQQLQEDEEMARRLQEQEDAYAYLQRGDNGKSRPNGRQRKYVPLEDRRADTQTKDVAHAAPVPLPPPVKSLESIMQEEEEEEKRKQKFQKLLEIEGGSSAMSTRVKRLQLYERFPKVDRSAVDSCFEANCFNMSETVEAIKWSLDQGHQETRSKSENRSSDLDRNLVESTKQQSMQEMLDSYIYMPKVNKDYQDGADPEYEDFRGEANLHFRLRHECFQKAQEAFRQGLKQVASFYSQQGHLHTQKIKEANMRASEQILAERNGDLMKNGTLDFHGLHIDEAIAALDRILPDLERGQSKKYVTIITGRGSHSRGGVARLRPSVIAYLRRFQYMFSEEQTGVIKVTLRYRPADK